MADDDEESLTLNLTVPVVEGAKTKEDAPGKRKQNDSLESEKFSAKKRKKKLPEDEERENDAAGERSNSSGKDKDQAFISSLFNHNPDIPTLDLTNVTPLHEQVFTSRSFSEVGVHPYLVQNLEQNLGAKEMTQVQMRIDSVSYVFFLVSFHPALKNLLIIKFNFPLENY